MNEHNDGQEHFGYVTLFEIPALLSEDRVARQSICLRGLILFLYRLVPA